MKRIMVLLLVFMVSFSLIGADGEKAFHKGTKMLDLSVGFSSLTTPFAVGYEQGITENLGINVSALILSWGYDFGFVDLNQTLIMPQAHLVYHFTKIKSPKLDVYAGAGAGFSIYNSDWMNETLAGGVFISGIIGVRYYVSKKIAISLRETLVIIGDWDGSYTLLGVTFKF
jgi:Outer membrane protein beta-barrel domain